MSHDDAAMYERAIKEGREKEMNCQDIRDEGMHCDFCEVSHPSDYDCDENILANMILDLDRKVNDQWEINYKSIENISKRMSKIEDICVTDSLIFTMRQTIETWQKGCEVQLNVLMKCNQELEKRVDKIEEEIETYDLSDHDERINDIENIGAESRLIRLEAYNKMDKDMTPSDLFLRLCRLEEKFDTVCKNFDDNRVIIKREPFKCPVCEGRRNITTEMPNGAYFDFPCKSCKGEGIVWI